MLIRFRTALLARSRRVTCRLRGVEDGLDVSYEGLFRDGSWLFDIPDDGWTDFALVLDGQARLIERTVAGQKPPFYELSDWDLPPNGLPQPDVPVDDNRLQQLWFGEGADLDVWDVIVVGTGMGGGVLQWALAEQGRPGRQLSVLGLEAGSYLFPTHAGNLPRMGQGPVPQGATSLWSTYTGLASQPYATSPDHYEGHALFALGGRSLYWGALCPRISAAEFAAAWPPEIAADLVGHRYAEAEALLGVVAPPRDPATLDLIARVERVFPGRVTEPAPVAATTPRPTSGTVGSGLFSTAELLLGQRLGQAQNGVFGPPDIHLSELVTRVEPRGDVWRVDAVDLRDGTVARHHAHTVVLAAGTVETTRILLASRDAITAAGREITGSGLLGTGFTEHPMAFVHFEIPANSPLARPGRSVRLLSYPDPFSGQDLNLQIVLGSDFDDGRAGPPSGEGSTTQVDPGAVAGQLVFFGRASLTADAVVPRPEQWPDQDRLAGSPDSLPAVDLAVATGVREAVGAAFAGRCQTMADALLAALGAVPLPGVGNLAVQPSAFGWVSHEVGTVRLEGPAGDGVVSRDLEVKGCDGLYVCDNSVFPASPAANPSLTLAALALRLAERLRA